MNNAIRVQATREAGAVQRFHVARHTRNYDVAQHTFGALNLLLILHPNPSIELVRAVMWHDVAERWTGDIPATAKWMSEELKAGSDRLEARILGHLGLEQKLNEEEERWLKAVDTLDAWLWCRENSSDPHVYNVGHTYIHYLWQMFHDGKLPQNAADFFVSLVDRPYSVLPDQLHELEKTL